MPETKTRIRKSNVSLFLESILYTYKAKVLRVIDGDTLEVLIDVGFNMRYETKLRLEGINTPEINTLEGKKAKLYVESRIKENNNEIIIRTKKTGKYGRWIATVWLPDSDKPLNKELLDLGLAEPYE